MDIDISTDTPLILSDGSIKAEKLSGLNFTSRPYQESKIFPQSKQMTS
jgi:hypothetical protein